MTADINIVTRDDILMMVYDRQDIWMEMSGSIAETLPHVWKAIAQYVKSTTVLLVDIQFDMVSDMLTYTVVENQQSNPITIPIPISLIANPGKEDVNLVEYLHNLPPLAVVSQLDAIKQRLRNMLLQFPDMYMDLDRVAQLEFDATQGQLVKFPTVDTPQ